MHHTNGFSDIFVEGDLTYEETEKYQWTTANIGPKWSYFEDFSAEEDDVYFSGESAWSSPEQGLEKLLGILVEYDPKIITSISYEDEGPNFFGADIYEGEEMYDGIEHDYEETIDLVINDSERLTEESYVDDEWVEIKEDLANGANQSVKGLLMLLPVEKLKGYLTEEQIKKINWQTICQNVPIDL